MTVTGSKESRDELAGEANRVRSKLLDAVEQLERRGHAALDLRRQIRGHWRLVAILGGLLMVSTGGVVAVAFQRAAHAAQRRRRARWILAKTLWSHPERSLRERRPPLLDAALSAMLAALTSVVSWEFRRAFRSVDGRALPRPLLTETGVDTTAREAESPRPRRARVAMPHQACAASDEP